MEESVGIRKSSGGWRMIELSPIVACICEGGAEAAIIDMLVENNLLIFTRDQMLNEDIIRCRNGKEFEQRYLRKGFESKITILRILDSHTERFRLSPAYEHKVDVIKVVTSPEIEMLLILGEGKYNDYIKKASAISPSTFCKQELKMNGNIKSQKFIRDYFSNINVLINTIREYKRVKMLKRGEIYLADLLKEI